MLKTAVLILILLACNSCTTVPAQVAGYRELSSTEGLERLVASTNAYAKRQRTWFRNQLEARSISGGRTEEMFRQAMPLLAAKNVKCQDLTPTF